MKHLAIKSKFALYFLSLLVSFLFAFLLGRAILEPVLDLSSGWLLLFLFLLYLCLVGFSFYVPYKFFLKYFFPQLAHKKTSMGLWGAFSAPILFIGVVFFCVFLAPALYNMYYVEGGFLRSLKHLDLPGNSKVIDAQSSFGLMGNGNHCDIHALALVESDLEPLAFIQALDEEKVLIDYPYMGKQEYGHENWFAIYYNFQTYYLDEKGRLFAISEDASLEEISLFNLKTVDKEDLSLYDQVYFEILQDYQPQEGYYYFLLDAFDTAYGGFTSNDIRCH